MGPGSLQELKQRGRLVYVLRNPKDCLNSLHYFRGEAKDGWTGNEHGPGSLARFLTGVNAYGSIFDHVATMEDFINAHLGERAIVLYYERLKEDITAEIERVAKFLKLEMTPAKLEFVRSEVDIKTMASKKSSFGSMLIRKGVTKDWENADVSPEKWAEFDEVFEKTIGQRMIAQPFRPYMLPSPALPEEKRQSMPLVQAATE